MGLDEPDFFLLRFAAHDVVKQSAQPDIAHPVPWFQRNDDGFDVLFFVCYDDRLQAPGFCGVDDSLHKIAAASFHVIRRSGILHWQFFPQPVHGPVNHRADPGGVRMGEHTF